MEGEAGREASPVSLIPVSLPPPVPQEFLKTMMERWVGNAAHPLGDSSIHSQSLQHILQRIK